MKSWARHRKTANQQSANCWLAEECQLVNIFEHARFTRKTQFYSRPGYMRETKTLSRLRWNIFWNFILEVRSINGYCLCGMHEYSVIHSTDIRLQTNRHSAAAWRSRRMSRSNDDACWARYWWAPTVSQSETPSAASRQDDRLRQTWLAAVQGHVTAVPKV